MTSHVICQGSDFEELPLNVCAVGLNDWWIAGYSEALKNRRIGITNAFLVADRLVSGHDCRAARPGVTRPHNQRHAIQGDERSKEKFMRKVSSSTLRKQGGAILVLVFFLGATVSSASSKHSPGKPATSPSKIIAHLVLSGGPASQMFLREQNGKHYLLIRQTSEVGVTVVDVTKPGQPNIVNRSTWPNDTSSGNLEIVGGGLALEETPEPTGRTLTNSNPKETVQVLDLSDATNPVLLESFAGVTSVLNDAVHNLVYFTNSDGLWILRHQPNRSMIEQPHRCLSEDATNETASCQ